MQHSNAANGGWCVSPFGDGQYVQCRLAKQQSMSVKHTDWK